MLKNFKYKSIKKYRSEGGGVNKCREWLGSMVRESAKALANFFPI